MQETDDHIGEDVAQFAGRGKGKAWTLLEEFATRKSNLQSFSMPMDLSQQPRGIRILQPYYRRQQHALLQRKMFTTTTVQRFLPVMETLVSECYIGNLILTTILAAFQRDTDHYGKRYREQSVVTLAWAVVTPLKSQGNI